MKVGDLILALDQGTTGSTAALYSAQGMKLIASHSVDFKQHYPRPGWVEHAPSDIWRSVLSSIHGALKHVKRPATCIVGIGITNQRETTIGWSRSSGTPQYPAIVWQDRRTASFCDQLKRSRAVTEKIHSKTGLVVDPYFSASKMRWILKEQHAVQRLIRNNDLCFGTIDTYLIWKLTQGRVFATDHTNASRTMLYDLRTGSFDAWLCDLFEVTKSALPEIRPSAASYGVTKGVPGLPDGIPITGVLGDQQAALLGQNCTRPGEGKITYGTGAFCLLNVGKKVVLSGEGLLTSVAFSIGKERTFALEGSAFIAGAAIQFLRDQFGWIERSEECETLAQQEPRDPGLHFIPALAGLAAPYWNPNARGVLWGLTRGSSPSQITRAVVESIAFQNVVLFRTMQRAFKRSLMRVGVDGGASQNDMLMQFQADLFQTKLVRPENIETTSKGAAIAARLGINPAAGIAASEPSKTFRPKMPKQNAAQLTTRWLNAVEAVNAFYTPAA